MSRVRAAVLLAASAALQCRWAAGEAPAAASLGDLEVALVEGDECSAEGGQHCALSALQLRGAKVSAHQHRQLDDLALDELTLDELAELGRRVALTETGAEAAFDQARGNLTASAWAAEGFAAPSSVHQYAGVAWPPMSVLDNGAGETHIFAIGDWGALLPRHYTAPNKRPSGKCPGECGYVHGIDDRAQLLVANQMRARAGASNPQYVLNVGDNFYWAGIRESCGRLHTTSQGASMYSAAWSSIYGDLTNRPWLSVLGNHDYGGWQFNAGWDQQISYTFVNRNWVMPARYYSRVMEHPGFNVEYFMIDSNAFDAGPPGHDPEHNICGGEHNPPGATCASVGGPTGLGDCQGWFWSHYRAQQQWLEQKLAASTARWKVVVTHFPCGHDAGWYKKLHGMGLDLLVTGHRHDQELWPNSGMLGGLTCFVTGGGGGITSENSPDGAGTGQYGFFDLTISFNKIFIQSINLAGNVIASATVTKSGSPADAPASAQGDVNTTSAKGAKVAQNATKVAQNATKVAQNATDVKVARVRTAS